MESNRQKKFSRLIQKELSEMLQREIVLPGSPLVTVSVIRSSPDLQVCKIYVSVFPEASGQAVVKHLTEKNWEVRQTLARRVRQQIRAVPELMFYLDDTQQEVARIEELFDKIQKPEETPE